MDRAVRRLAAIVAADVVGYSRKMEADEGATLAALKDLLSATIAPLLSENTGRMVKTMGDGFIAEFGSVVDAVAFAVAMQRAVPQRQSGTAAEHRLVFRVGINLGDVVVEGDDLLGDGVNVAARLEQLSAPGGIMISGTAYDHLQGKLGLPLDFAGEQQVKNISRPVRTYVVRLDGSGPSWRHAVPRRLKRARPAIAAGVIAMMLAGGVWWYERRATLPLNPSIAVMPFEDLGGDAAADRLARGVTSEIATDFSRFRDFDVIDAAATEAYGKKGADIRQIARDLNVRYVLRGSIQREGEQIQLNAQVFDGLTGASLWSKRWDRPAADVFAVQNEVADGVISTLGDHNLLLGMSAAAAKRKAPSDLAAYDLYALGYESYLKGSLEGMADALKYADVAIAKDPQLTLGYVLKGFSIRELAVRGNLLGKGSLQDAMEEVGRVARQAIEVDPYEAWGHLLAGTTLRQTGGDPVQASAELDRALELNPSSANVMNAVAGSMSYLGKPEEGAALCDRAFRLNPLPPPWYPNDCAPNYFFMKRYREAINMVRQAAATYPLTQYQLSYFAASQIALGEVDDATANIAEWKRRLPDATLEELLGSLRHFYRKQEEDQLLAPLQTAGAPICIPSDKLGNFPKFKHLALCDAQRAKEAVR
jgi:class 3 adenylate cyclase/TolB-like protein/Tfp pilus assembly protein PilF